MFDRQLPKSRALISGTSSPRIIFQRWSFNDINLYPCSCSKDNNHDHFSLWLRNAKKLKLFSRKKPVALFVRFILSRERKSGKSARKMLKLQAQRSRRTRGGSGGVSSLRPIQVNIPRPSGSRFSKDCTSNETP